MVMRGGRLRPVGRTEAPPPFVRTYGVWVGSDTRQMPRPWVTAMMESPAGLSRMSLTDAAGRFAPNRYQVPPCGLNEIITPTSLATTSLPLARKMASAGTSGKLPLMSVHVAPPSVVSNTCPSPADIVFVQRREKPLKTT